MNFFTAFLFCVAAYTIGRMNGILTESEKRYDLEKDIDALRRDLRELRNADKFGFKGK